MDEYKKSKKPLYFYYGIVLAAIILFNALVMPFLINFQIKEMDYGTFMTMTENNEIGQVEIQDNQILFTNKDNGQIYKTGLMNDPDLVSRLHNLKEIVEYLHSPEKYKEIGASMPKV